jgi:hypothetical protein
MMTFWGFVVGAIFGAIGAIVAWLTTEFIGRPFRRFFDLRGEVCRRMVRFDNNVFARARMVDSNRREPIELSSDQDARLTERKIPFVILPPRCALSRWPNLLLCGLSNALGVTHLKHRAR